MDTGQRSLPRELRDEFGDGHRFQVRLPREPAVKRVEERVAIGLVRIPAVFAVESDHRQQRLILLPLLDGTEPTDEVRGRLVGR